MSTIIGCSKINNLHKFVYPHIQQRSSGRH